MKTFPLLLSALLFLPVTAIHAAASAKSPAQPNIIYILLDDAGYGDIDSYGQKTLRTPNMDRLAREGMKFTRHYAGSTVCAPSRGTLACMIAPRTRRVHRTGEVSRE